MATPPSHLRLRPLLLLLVLLLPACQSDAADGEQPALARQTEPELGIQDAGEAGVVAGDGDSALVDADFADVPLPSGAEPFDQAQVIDGVTVQNYTLTAMSASEALAHFQQVLPAQGWTRGADASMGTEAEGDAGEGADEGSGLEAGAGQGDDEEDPGAAGTEGEGSSVGAEQLQSTWTKDGKTLLISTADSGEAGTQLSLQLSGG